MVRPEDRDGPMQILLVISLAASIGLQCGATEPAAQKAAAQGEWVSCITKAVSRLDDGRSDAASVAAGVAPVCSSSYQTMINAMMCSADTAQYQKSLSRNAPELERKLATAAVLAYRAKTRQQQVSQAGN
jgi:hypothetical protein